MGKDRIRVAAALVAVLVVTTACAAGPHGTLPAEATAPPGFWWGLWHGLITPVTFVISLFTDSVNVYALPNKGNWYDFGFVLGISMVFSGGAGGARAGGRSR